MYSSEEKAIRRETIIWLGIEIKKEKDPAKRKVLEGKRTKELKVHKDKLAAHIAKYPFKGKSTFMPFEEYYKRFVSRLERQAEGRGKKFLGEDYKEGRDWL